MANQETRLFPYEKREIQKLMDDLNTVLTTIFKAKDTNDKIGSASAWAKLDTKKVDKRISEAQTVISKLIGDLNTILKSH